MPETPIEETLRALDDLINGGKGSLHRLLQFSAAQLEDAHAVAARHGLRRLRLMSGRVQPARSRYRKRSRCRHATPRPRAASVFSAGERIIDRQIPGRRAVARRLPACQQRAPRRWSLNARNWRIVDALRNFAAARGHTLLELAMSWLAGRPFISSIIAGATQARAGRANVAAVDWALSAAELAEIDRITL